MKIVLIALLLPFSAAFADTTSSDQHPSAMEQQASPSNPVKQDEERTEAHSQPDVPKTSADAQPPSGDASQGASSPASDSSSVKGFDQPKRPDANRANNANYYQSGAFNEIHPEEAYPNNLPRLTSNGDDSELIAQVQRRLHAYGFDAGPVNGDFGSKTQAALAQFQLSQTLPVSGSLDSPTLNALGVVAGLAPSASTGSSAPSSSESSSAVSPPSRPSP
jgi:hypothetical protein